MLWSISTLATNTDVNVNVIDNDDDDGDDDDDDSDDDNHEIVDDGSDSYYDNFTCEKPSYSVSTI